MKHPVISLLRAGRALLADPAKWCQEKIAKTSAGVGVMPNDPTARPRTLSKLAENSEDNSDAFTHLEQAIKELHPGYYQDPAYFNDSHSHSEVLAVFDKAIEYAAS